jgi:hypothetical protein
MGGASTRGSAGGANEPDGGAAPNLPAGGASDGPGNGGASSAGATGGVPEDPEAGGGASPAAGGSTGGAAPAPEPPLRTAFFSEYVEGTGNKKALEIAALVAQPLNGCSIEVFANGAARPSASWALEADVLPETPWVLCTKDLVQILGGACRQENALSFNGDDAVLLRCDGNVVDSIGQLEYQPDKQWGSGELRTVDMTLRRACAVVAGDPLATDPFEPSTEWTAAGTDEFSGLGSHCLDGTTP